MTQPHHDDKKISICQQTFWGREAQRPEVLNYEEYVAGLRRSNAELLKALRTIEGAFWSDGERYREQVTDLKDIARAAIAQATGVAS